jgi:hypothetical protein
MSYVLSISYIFYDIDITTFYSFSKFITYCYTLRDRPTSVTLKHKINDLSLLCGNRETTKCERKVQQFEVSVVNIMLISLGIIIFLLSVLIPNNGCEDFSTEVINSTLRSAINFETLVIMSTRVYDLQGLQVVEKYSGLPNNRILRVLLRLLFIFLLPI